jgi:hypothetical protein
VSATGTAVVVDAFAKIDQREMLHPSLGPLRIRLYTKYLLIHGFLRASIYIPSAAQACTIVDIRVALSQQVRLENLTNPREYEEPNPYVMTLWRLSNEAEHEDGIKLAEGEKLDVHRVVVSLRSCLISLLHTEWCASAGSATTDR